MMCYGTRKVWDRSGVVSDRAGVVCNGTRMVWDKGRMMREIGGVVWEVFMAVVETWGGSD